MTAPGQPFEDIAFTTRDGLRLHVRRYPAGASQYVRRPVICLPGLTRNGRDFHSLAVALSAASETSRDVYTFDYRGRGLSEFDPDWRNYTVPVEMQDVLEFLTARELIGAGLIGTSRGGLIAMVLAAAQPAAVGPVVLNDIGPVIERSGLARISAYAGRIPLPGSWKEATKLVRDLNSKAFPAIPEDMWETVARQWFNERNGQPAPGYDKSLANSLSVLDGPMPPLWPQFEALKRVPVFVLRGEHSDILSQATVDEMKLRHPALTSFTVKGQGHAPFLHDKPSIEAIRAFFLAEDGAEASIYASVA